MSPNLLRFKYWDIIYDEVVKKGFISLNLETSILVKIIIEATKTRAQWLIFIENLNFTFVWARFVKLGLVSNSNSGKVKVKNSAPKES